MYILLIKTYKKLNFISNKVAIPFSLSGKFKKKILHSNFLYIAKTIIEQTDQLEKISITLIHF